MLSASIFLLHALLSAVLFLRGRRQSTSDGVLGIATVLLIFAVGWTLSTFVVNLIWPERGIGLLIDEWSDTAWKRFLYREVTQDSAALVLLTVAEVPFYVMYLKRRKR